jgi:hypothetical protein
VKITFFILPVNHITRAGPGILSRHRSTPTVLSGPKKADGWNLSILHTTF